MTRRYRFYSYFNKGYIGMYQVRRPGNWGNHYGTVIRKHNLYVLDIRKFITSVAAYNDLNNFYCYQQLRIRSYNHVRAQKLWAIHLIVFNIFSLFIVNGSDFGTLYPTGTSHSYK